MVSDLQSNEQRVANPIKKAKNYIKVIFREIMYFRIMKLVDKTSYLYKKI